MNDTDPSLSGSYLYIPSKRNPRVALAVNNSSVAKTSFSLYQPFSWKAKIVKYVTFFLFCQMNWLFRPLFAVKEDLHIGINSYLKDKLKKHIILSVYFATCGNKVVLQAQSLLGDLIGYMKVPLNDVGKKGLQVEFEGLSIFSSLGVASSVILESDFDETALTLLEPVGGQIGLPSERAVLNCLEKLKRNEKFRLSMHPRVLALEVFFRGEGYIEYAEAVKLIVSNSECFYALVYEHGDFTTWNMAEKDGECKLFDFEYYCRNGLEYLDQIKYYFSIGRLLKKLKNEELLEFVCRNVKMPEPLLLVRLFVVKEIASRIKYNETREFEEVFLSYLEDM